MNVCEVCAWSSVRCNTFQTKSFWITLAGVVAHEHRRQVTGSKPGTNFPTSLDQNWFTRQLGRAQKFKHTFLRNKYFDYFVDFLNGLPLNVARSLQKVLKQFFSSEMTFAGFPLLPPSLFTRLPCASVPASSQRHVLLIPK